MESTVEPLAESFPQAILSPVEWMEVRRSVEVGGMTVREASEAHKVGYDAVRQRALREDWLTPAKIAEKIRQKEQEARDSALSQVVASRSVTGEKTAESPHLPVTASSARLNTFLDYRDRSLLKLAKVADKGLEQVISADLPIENWQDAKIVADIAMKLHNVGQEGVNVNVLVGGDGGFDGPVIEIGEECDMDETGDDD